MVETVTPLFEIRENLEPDGPYRKIEVYGLKQDGQLNAAKVSFQEYQSTTSLLRDEAEEIDDIPNLEREEKIIPFKISIDKALGYHELLSKELDDYDFRGNEAYREATWGVDIYEEGQFQKMGRYVDSAQPDTVLNIARNLKEEANCQSLLDD